jgi:hypothetical protein
MPTAQDYMNNIKQLDHGGLLALWAQIRARATPEWDEGKAFEYLILRAFELESAEVQYPFQVTLQEEVVEQIDGAIHVNGISAIVESKDFSDGRRVNVEPISKLRNQLLRRPASVIGMIFSRTGFTDPASVLAQFLSPQTILLWEGSEIERALTRSKLVQGMAMKHRMAVELGQNDFNLLSLGATWE